MPKLKQTKQEKEKAEDNARFDFIRGEIGRYRAIHGISIVELGVTIGLSCSCMNVRINNPGTFRLEELMRLSRILKVDLIEKMGKENNEKGN